MSSGNEALLREFFDRFNRLDVEGQLEMLASDYDWRPAYTGGGLVEGEVYRGPEGFRRYLAMLAETWSEIKLEIEELHELDERVLVFARIHAIGRASGVPVDQRFGGIWIIRGGKFVRGRAYETREEAKLAAGLERRMEAR